MKNVSQQKTMKRTFWGASVFYVLIAFEFFYMASPFAAYFYGLYRPALNFFNDSPSLSWLIKFFMPHAVRETQSTLINIHDILGAVLATFGLLGFCYGACQVYYSKLRKRGAVTGGIYNYIRHPQYASFMLWGLGLLLMWPRYIVLVMFVTMIFVYYFLALAEEKECEIKFGQSYVDYKNKTNRFFPISIPILKRLPPLPNSRLKKSLAIIFIYICSLTLSIFIARFLNNLTINSLYATYTDNTANISINKIKIDKLNNIMNIALTDEEVKTRISRAAIGDTSKFINYVLPTEWYAAEVPMNGVKDGAGHASPSNYNENLYKIIFTKAIIRSDKNVSGKDIIRNVVERLPVVEVWVDISENRVIGIYEIPHKIMYKNTPVAVY